MTPSEQPDQTERYFAAVAETYDRLQPVIVGPSYEPGLAFACDLVPYDERDVFAFVELGCGTAALATAILDRFPNSTAVCIDSEPAMLTVAARKLAAYGDRACAKQAEATTCELPSADVVVSSFMFHHVPPEEMTGVLSRIASSLKPNGCLILLDQMTAGPMWAERVGAQNRRLQEKHVLAAIAAGKATRQEIDDRWALKRRMQNEGKDVGYRHSAEQIYAAMKASGFNDMGLVWRMLATTILVGFT